jgi:transcription elongation factor
VLFPIISYFLFFFCFSKPKKLTRYNFFNEEAEVASDEDEEEYEAAEEEEILDKDTLDAIARVQKRHDVNREFQKKSEAELAEEIERRYKVQEQIKQQYEDAEGFAGPQATPVAQQALLPSFKDPKLFKIKCKPLHEQIAIRSIMLKTIDVFNRDRDFYKIKSAFCGTSKGYIYVESLNEAFAKEVLNGLKMIYLNSFQQVPIQDMTSVLSVTITKKPLKPGQYIRIKRGVLKGDLARIVNIFDGETKALIQAVPRLLYSAENGAGEVGGGGPGKKKVLLTSSKIRPPQSLFDAEQAANSGYVFRRHHPLDQSSALYDVWNNEYYRDGFLFKEVTIDTFIDSTEVRPKLEELKMFAIKKPSKAILPTHQKKQKNPEDDDNPDDEDEQENHEENDQNEDPLLSGFNADLQKEIDKMKEDEGAENSGSNPFVPGDLVQVVGGELINLVGRVLSLNDVLKTARIRPYNNSLLTEECEVETNLLVKYVFAGAHVKVMTGKYSGQTGRVVTVISEPGDSQLAVILTDGLNTEIKCNVSLLQLSDEVASGLGSLMGFELYDLVSLSENESAVIINVGVEKLKAINHLGIVKDISPQEIRLKLNTVSNRTKAIDGFHNTFSVGDSVHVVTGTHSKLSGTVKHINKGTVWVHSTSYLRNSGVFVVKGKNLMLAGGSSSSGGLSTIAGGMGSYNRGGGGGVPSSSSSATSTPAMGISRSPFNNNNNNSGNRGGGMGGGGDPNEAKVGETVRITKGGFKGHLAQVVDITSTHYSVELLTKFKKVVIPKGSCLRVGDRQGSFDRGFSHAHAHPAHMAPANQPEYIAASTPFLSAATPLHVLGGSETPAIFGSETPYGAGMGGYDDPDRESAWKISENDVFGGHGQGENDSQLSFSRTTTPLTEVGMGGGGSVMGMTPLSLMSEQQQSTSHSHSQSSSYQSSSHINNNNNNSGTDSNLVPGMVVGIKKGKQIGRLAVIHQLLEEVSFLCSLVFVSCFSFCCSCLLSLSLLYLSLLLLLFLFPFSISLSPSILLPQSHSLIIIYYSQNGQCKVRIRDGNGRLQDEEINLGINDVGAAEPPKGGFVFVLKGIHRGRSGVVKVRKLTSFCFSLSLSYSCNPPLSLFLFFSFYFQRRFKEKNSLCSSMTAPPRMYSPRILSLG